MFCKLIKALREHLDFVIPFALAISIAAIFAFGLNKSEVANWVQAVGSIVAIAASFSIAKKQFEEADIESPRLN